MGLGKSGGLCGGKNDCGAGRQNVRFGRKGSEVDQGDDTGGGNEVDWG